MGKYVINQTATGVTFHLKADNGQIIATSEVYSSEEACKKGIASVAKNAPIAPIEDQTAETVDRQKCPKFELYTDKAGEYRFRLKASNGENIAASQGYTEKESAQKGVASVKANADSQTVKEEA